MNVADEPLLYPGSLQILAQLPLLQDRLPLNEKPPSDAYALRGAMRGTPTAARA